MSESAKLEKALCKLTASQDAETSAIASTAERLLTVQPHHVYALQCKTVALLHAGKFAAALKVLERLGQEKMSPQHVASFYFHRAYCHYRLMQYAEAKAELQRLQQQGSPTPAARHLLAQIHYNLEEYAEAATIYEALVADKVYRDEVEKQELLTNYTAALTAIAPGRVAAVVRDDADEKTADLLFNLAAAQVEEQNYEAAQKTLLQAEQLCLAAFPQSKLRTLQSALHSSKEELQAQLGVPLATSASGSAKSTSTANPHSPERLFFNEVSSNWVQQAYVAFVCHREEEATQIVHLISTYKSSSAITNVVASILHTALLRHADFFDSHRKLKAAQHVKVSSRLTSRQLIAVYYNMALLQLGTGALDRCARTLELLEKSHPNSELTHSLRLILAVRQLKKKRAVLKSSPVPSEGPTSATVTDSVHECVRRYEAEAARRQGPGSSEAEQKKRHCFMQLVTAQLFLEQGDLAAAAAALQSLDDAALMRYPATVMTLASWKVQVGDVDGAMALLHERLTAISGGYSAGVKKAVLLWAVQDLAFSRGLYGAVGRLLKAVQDSDDGIRTDREMMALLVMCLAETDIPAAKRIISALDSDAAAALSSGAGNTHSIPSEAQVEALLRNTPGVAALNELGYRRVTAADEDALKNEGISGHSNVGGLARRRSRAARRPARNMDGKADPERWIPMPMRSYIKDLPERRKRELKRLRAIEQEQKRRAAVANQRQKQEAQLSQEKAAAT